MASTAAAGGHGHAPSGGADPDVLERAALLAFLRALRGEGGADDFALRAAYERGREDERAGMAPRRRPAARPGHLHAVRG